jgi:hypothetical protein
VLPENGASACHTGPPRPFRLADAHAQYRHGAEHFQFAHSGNNVVECTPSFKKKMLSPEEKIQQPAEIFLFKQIEQNQFGK